MSNLWCCWFCCQRTRTLSATELLVAASYNTAVRRISRANSDDSLDNVSLKYNTFDVPPVPFPIPTRHKPSFRDNSTKDKDDEMNNLVKPLRRHQEQMRMVAQIDERETLQMAGSGSPKDIRRQSFDSESRSSMFDNSSEENSMCISTNVISAQDAEDMYSDEEDGTLEGKCYSYPLDECFGSIIASAKIVSPRIIAVLLLQLRGVPWVGSNEGLTLEIKSKGFSKSEWIFLPNGRGPEVNVQREVTLKLHKPSHKQSSVSPYPQSNGSDQDTIQITVWSGCTHQHRYSAIGYALIPIKHNEANVDHIPRILGLYGQTKVHADLGSLEISMSSSSTSSSNTTRSRGILIKILKTKGLQKPTFNWIAKKAKKALNDKDRLDVWCSVTLWISGEKIKKIITPKIMMPVTNDPDFKTSCTFFIPKREQHKASIVIKIHCGRSINEVTIGRVVLGPLLYLGAYRHPPLLPLDTSNPRPVTLSYWGKSMNCPYPVTAWHRLKL